MFSRELSRPTEFETIIEIRKKRIQDNYFTNYLIENNTFDYSVTKENVVYKNAFSIDFLSTENVFFKKSSVDINNNYYDPIIFSSFNKIHEEDKLEVSFAGYIISKMPGFSVSHGKVILLDMSEKIIRLSDRINTIYPTIDTLSRWVSAPPEELPVILNKHCVYCEFQHVCKPIAENQDSISLLGGISAKEIIRYEQKGIFTIKQLSFLFRPRKRGKSGKSPPIVHKYELQALALRTGNIYLYGEQSPISKNDTEIFFDFEVLPENNFHYLIGLIICTTESEESFQFWADTQEDEKTIWNQFVFLIDKYPNSTLFHYGNFERKAIEKLGVLYDTPTKPIIDRLFNINTSIFGKIYFPVRSNGLKDICQFIGLSWTSKQASGLQSIIWRYRYDDTGDQCYRDILMTYNLEDCDNLKKLTTKLREIGKTSAHSSKIRFADKEGASLSEAAEDIVGCFENILKSAHGTYEQTKIKLKKSKKNQKSPPTEKSKPSQTKRLKIDKVIKVRRGRICPNHPGLALTPKETESKHTVVDLIFTPRGVKKTSTQYIGKMGYCWKCKTLFSPPGIRRVNKSKYGHGLKAWIAYNRMALRLPLDKISQLFEDMFCVSIASSQIYCLIKQASQYYEYTEEILLKKILESPVVHVDETKINIQGVSQYVWVITDGLHVIFRQTETREPTLIHELFDGYLGVLCSDFYGGYDSIDCLQQKCWAHLIRDLNDDLRKTPFDTELESFVSEVRDLIVPIFDTVEKYGLKKIHLQKFQKSVNKFYEVTITGKTYKSATLITYQKRFLKYKDKLFLFINMDGIPWNNNMAERAIRHLAVQRKISGSFRKDGIKYYLLLLGITQTCRFQNKSLLQFLLSGEKDVDKFKNRGNFDGWPEH